jgi:DNA-binding Lrp family transcriptional regulator
LLNTFLFANIHNEIEHVHIQRIEPKVWDRVKMFRGASLMQVASTPVEIFEREIVNTKDVRSQQPRLSEVDKIIIQKLITSKKRSSAIQLSRETDVPVTTMMRRMRKLEQRYLTVSYDLNLEAFGLAKLYLLVRIAPGAQACAVADNILCTPFVNKVSRVFGATKDNLLVEAIVRSGDFVDSSRLIEIIKNIHQIEDVTWFTDIEQIGRNHEALLACI